MKENQYYAWISWLVELKVWLEAHVQATSDTYQLANYKTR